MDGMGTGLDVTQSHTYSSMSQRDMTHQTTRGNTTHKDENRNEMKRKRNTSQYDKCTGILTVLDGCPEGLSNVPTSSLSRTQSCEYMEL